MVNDTEREVPFTRIIEHKHFRVRPQRGGGDHSHHGDHARVSGELAAGRRAVLSHQRRAQHEALVRAEAEGDGVRGRRLGGYKYYDMDKAIAAAFDLVKAELGGPEADSRRWVPFRADLLQARRNCT